MSEFIQASDKSAFLATSFEAVVADMERRGDNFYVGSWPAEDGAPPVVFVAAIGVPMADSLYAYAMGRLI